MLLYDSETRLWKGIAREAIQGIVVYRVLLYVTVYGLHHCHPVLFQGDPDAALVHLETCITTMFDVCSCAFGKV